MSCMHLLLPSVPTQHAEGLGYRDTDVKMGVSNIDMGVTDELGHLNLMQITRVAAEGAETRQLLGCRIVICLSRQRLVT
ncbi:hypothetical protein LSAT2_017269 [Lamellibrachia satsuma]|nr:hypothetical protein LSAT2_017269 [Lamellibrachia satsuma]